MPAYNTKNEIGNKYGKLTVIARSNKKSKSRLAFWDCLCECGNITTVSGSNLRRGNTFSCGCYNKQKVSENSMKDETGNVYGLLTVLKRSEKPSDKHGIYWDCLCECGTLITVLGCNLRNNHTISCGCIRSIGEYNIAKLLKENNINFKKEISFNNLIGKNNNKLRFDFGIYNEKWELIKIIEFDGEQHYDINNPYYSDENLKRDKIKEEYLKFHNISFIRIPYKKRDILTIEDII
jgi:hypothetical protein